MSDIIVNIDKLRAIAIRGDNPVIGTIEQVIKLNLTPVVIMPEECVYKFSPNTPHSGQWRLEVGIRTEHGMVLHNPVDHAVIDSAGKSAFYVQGVRTATAPAQIIRTGRYKDKLDVYESLGFRTVFEFVFIEGRFVHISYLASDEASYADGNAEHKFV